MNTKKLLSCAALSGALFLLPSGILVAADNTSTSTEVAEAHDYEKDIEARIYIKFHQFLSDDLYRDVEYLCDKLDEQTERTDKFIAEANPRARASTSGVSWNIDKDRFSEITGATIRIPNWLPKDQLDFFSKGVDQIKTDTATLQKIAATLGAHYSTKTGIGAEAFNVENNKPYSDNKAIIDESVARLKKTVGALEERSFALAAAGEKRIAGDHPIAPALFAQQEDLDKMAEIVALVQNPALQDKTNTIAAETADKVEALCNAFKESVARHSAITFSSESAETKRDFTRFYKDDCGYFIDGVQNDVIKALRTKGVISDSTPKSCATRRNNALRCYNDFTACYSNLEGGFAFKR